METRNTINFEDFISTAIPIWKLFNMTEKQYTEKHWQPLHTNDISNIIIDSNSKKEYFNCFHYVYLCIICYLSPIY